MIPTKKISATLLEYAEPLISNLENGYTLGQLEEVLRMATCIWNSCVLDQSHNTTKNVELVRQHISTSNEPILIAIVEMMIDRKIKYFGDDTRGIVNECVIVKDGEFVVRAEARGDRSKM